MTYSSITVTNVETTLVETTIATDGEVHAALDLSALASGDTFVFRVYRRIDGTNYRLLDSYTLSGAQTETDLPVGPLWGNSGMRVKITGQRTAGTNRAIGVRTRTRF